MSIRFRKLIFLRFAILVLLAVFSLSSFAGFNFPTANGYYRANECYETISQLCVACDGRVSNGNTCTSVVVGSNACQVRNAQGNINGSTFSQSCSITCPAGQVRVNGICNVPPTCPAGKQYSITTGECEWITSCPAGQSLLTTASSGGTVTSAQCVPQSGNNFPCDTYARMQSSYCQGQASACKESGGTFGNVGGSNVCIPPGNGLPNCESGGTQYVTNSDGSKAPTCVGTPNIAGEGLPTEVNPQTATPQEAANATANNTAQIASINNQGFQSVVNAINNLTGKTAGGGAGIGEGEGQGEEGESGPCDPTQPNYATCIKQTEEVGDGEAQSKIDSASSNVAATFDDTKGEIIAMIDGEIVIDEPDSVMNAVDNLIPSSASSCSNLAFTFRGHVFSLDCDKFEPLRDILAWVFAVSTALFCFQIAFAPRSI